MRIRGYIPIRSCIGCGEKKPKREMIRIVCHDENIFIDPTGKASGRGAYICVSLDCLEEAIKKKAFSHALRCHIPSEVLEDLKRDLRQEILKRGEKDEKKNL